MRRSNLDLISRFITLSQQLLRSSAIVLFIIFIGCSESSTPPDNSAPATPGNFILLGGGDGQARFRWTKNSEPDLEFYRLYRSINNTLNFSAHVETVQLEYLDRFLNYDSTYYYYLVSVDLDEHESSPTNIIDVQPLNISAPQPPSFLLANAINNPIENRRSIVLSWLPPDAGDLNYYKIYRGMDQDFIVNVSSLIDSTIVGTYFDVSTSLNQRYYYRISAVDFGGKESSPSYSTSDLILTSAELTSPSNFGKFTSPFKFQWNEVDSAKAYKVFLGNSPFTEVFWESQKVSTTETTYTGSKLVSSNVYYWWVGTYSKDKSIVDNGTELEAQINSYSTINRFLGN